MSDVHPMIVAMAKAMIEHCEPARDFHLNPHYSDHVAEVAPVARAALTALLEPTPDMVEAVASAPPHWKRPLTDVQATALWADQMYVTTTFRDMIQQALTGAGQTTPATTKGER